MITQHLLTLSDIIVVNDLKRNVHAPQAEYDASCISDELGIKLDNFDDYNTMSAYLFPDASYDQLLAIIMLNNLLFYIDDLWDRNDDDVVDDITRRNTFEDIIHIFRFGEVKDENNVMQVSALKIRELMLPIANKAWLQRLIVNTQRHLKATTYDIADIENRNNSMLTSRYIELREHDSGMVPTVDLIEFAQDIYLPDEILQHEAVQKAIQCCIQSAALMNDLFSYEKEVLKLDSRFNLVHVIMTSENLVFEQAVHESVVLINDIIETFLALEPQLPSGNDVRLFYQGLHDQINAAWHWQLVGTNRYRSKNSPFSELRHFI